MYTPTFDPMTLTPTALPASTESRLDQIRDKVLAGRRLSLDDGLFLYEPTTPLHEVGQLANLVRERKNGNRAYYNVNTHLNPTNVCVYRCTFCAFRADLRDPKGYVMSDEQILARGREAVDSGCTEMHIVGGLHHQLQLRLVRQRRPHPARGLSRAAPQGLDRASKSTGSAVLAKKTVREILRRHDRRRPGQPARRRGGDLPSRSPRPRSASTRPTPARWLDIHRTAHELGLHSNCTMLYGHIENAYHRIDHLIRLRELQDETGGFQTFIPLAFHPDNTRPVAHHEAIGLMDLKTMAISRLMLDNFPHIKAYWIMLGISTAQVALAYGADDIDGTVVHEMIYHDAGATTPEMLSVEQIRRLIAEAGREPVERDTLYHRIVRDADNPSRWTVGEALLAEA